MPTIKHIRALKICRGLVTVEEVELLGVLKALGDETRFAMYRELAEATRALSTQDLAERLGLHANTVRLHLERLREAGLVEVEAIHRGTVGRPQHFYSLAPGSPSLGFDPPSTTLLAGLLGAIAERSGANADDAAEIGRTWGRDSARRTRARDCVRALEAEMARLGFDPATERDPNGDTVAFLRCPFRELAEAYPELVCNLHRGICEGIVDAVGRGSVTDFATLYDRDPCRVTVNG
jgi:predicted ArsR family transcriptional regulator